MRTVRLLAAAAIGLAIVAAAVVLTRADSRAERVKDLVDWHPSCAAVEIHEGKMDDWPTATYRASVT